MKVIIFGIGGRLGNAVYDMALKNNIEVVAGIDAFADSLSFPIPVYKTLKECNERADVLIDFSRPSSLDGIIEYVTTTNTPAVMSTTGYTKEQQAKLDEASTKVAIFQSSNMSLGVNLLIDLAKKAAQFLGREYDVEIIEQHHNRKVDAPSGTALSIANAINEVFDNNLDYVYGRTPESGKRQPNELGIHAIRGGTIVGKHDVTFIGSEEIVTLAHAAQSISVFALGAIRAAEFIKDLGPGKYNMNDLIGRDYSVTAVKGIKDIALISSYNVEYSRVIELFTKLADAQVNVDMISQIPTKNGYSVTFSTDSASVATAKHLLNETCEVREGLSQLVVIGAGMEHQSGVANTVVKLLNDEDIEIFAITTGLTQINCAVPTEKLQKAVDVLRENFSIRV